MLCAIRPICLAVALLFLALRPASSATIDFETNAVGVVISAPTLFSQATALTNLYAPLGVVWAGNGAIMDQSGGFGVSGFSPKNFLAYNSAGTFANSDPVGITDTMTFMTAQLTVSFSVGRNSPESFFARAFDVSGTLLDQFLGIVASPMAGVTLSGNGIVRIEYGLSDGAGAFVFDDLQLMAVPLPAALPLFAGGLGLIGLLGWRRKRKAVAV